MTITITESIPMSKGTLERTVTMTVNASKKFPNHTVMAERDFLYNTPEGQWLVVENAIYVPGVPPGPVAPPVITVSDKEGTP